MSRLIGACDRTKWTQLAPEGPGPFDSPAMAYDRGSCARRGANASLTLLQHLVKTVADPAVLSSLIERFERLTPESGRRWGTLTAHEMLCHLGDAFEMVLGIRPRVRPVPFRRRPILKAVGLWSPIRWPHGWPTNPLHDPRADGTRPSDFARDLKRTLAAIEAIATATPSALERVHGLFGAMSLADWQRWTYKHADHHLRQFGL